MTTYLIDYENTSHHGLEGFKKLTPQDTVVIFLGARQASSSMPIETVRELTWQGARPRLLWKRAKKTSKNYLDLQLVSYLGSLIGDPAIEEASYVIVSKDQDFLSAIDFWAERKREISVSLQPAIAPVTAHEVSSTQPSPDPASTQVSEATKRAVRNAVKSLQLKPSDYSAIYRAFLGSKNAQELHTKLTQDVKGRGQQVYPLVKEIYAQHLASTAQAN